MLLATLALVAAAPQADRPLQPPGARSVSVWEGTPGAIRARAEPAHGLQSGAVELQPFAQRLEVTWREGPEADPHGDVPGLAPLDAAAWCDDPAFPSSLLQTFPCAFDPTALELLGAGTWIVAGYLREGGARIERWELSWPDPMPALSGDASGCARVPLVAPERRAATLLWSSDEAGLERPGDLAALRRADGTVTDLLVLFDDSRELRRLDLADGCLTLLASPDRAGAPLGLLPALHRAGLRFVPAPPDRPDLAAALLMGLPGDPDPVRPLLALWDHDRDGLPDAATEERATQLLDTLPDIR